MAELKLSRVERWILANQYAILEKLQPEDADYFKNCRRVVAEGYELEYSWIAQQIHADEQGLSSAECNEVLEILRMYDGLQRGYDALADKRQVNADAVNFPGFDENSESKFVGYCRHFCDSEERRYESLRRPADWNSRSPMRDVYQRMLAVWIPYSQQMSTESLSQREIIEILTARRNPNSSAARLAWSKPDR